MNEPSEDLAAPDAASRAIRAVRVYRSLTRRDLAKAARMPLQRVKDIEAGYAPRADELRRLWEALYR
jgi:hypothetical protein